MVIYDTYATTPYSPIILPLFISSTSSPKLMTPVKLDIIMYRIVFTSLVVFPLGL
jgi:hypothetical protein